MDREVWTEALTRAEIEQMVEDREVEGAWREDSGERMLAAFGRGEQG